MTGKHRLSAVRTIVKVIDGGKREKIDQINEEFLSIYNARRRRHELEYDGFEVEIINKEGEIDKPSKQVVNK